MSGSTVWIVGQYRGEDPKGNAAWDIQGVFDSEQKAKAACRSEAYFVGPIEMNRPLPDGGVTWPGCYYPMKAQA